YDVGPNCLVMEFVEGTPLRGPLPLKQAVEYAGQILDALDTAHRKGITHRDLKPANILVTKQGVKLLDFGLAKRSASLQESEATLTGALTGKGEILGTLEYMSPEQLQGKEADARSDLFSFGCVLYEMLSGKRAFEGQSAASVIAAILEREPASIDMAPPLERVVRRCLAKDPDERFQNARDLKTALAWALEKPAVAKPRRRWWIAAVIATIVGVMGGWGIAQLRRPVAEDSAYLLQLNPPKGGSFTAGTNTIGGFSISPYGKTVAYVARTTGMIGLWIRRLDGIQERPIPETDAAGFPFWSPDSKSIGYFSNGKLLRVDLEGGPPLKICDAQARGASWGSDGFILYGTLTSGLFRAPAQGGEPVAVTTVDEAHGEYAHRWPQILPRGKFIYFVQGATSDANGVYAASFDKPAQRVRLLSTGSNAVFAAGEGSKGYL